MKTWTRDCGVSVDVSGRNFDRKYLEVREDPFSSHPDRESGVLFIESDLTVDQYVGQRPVFFPRDPCLSRYSSFILLPLRDLTSVSPLIRF